MKYQIVGDDDLQGLITKVNGAIGDGWKPQGGITYAPGTKFPYLQPMVK